MTVFKILLLIDSAALIVLVMMQTNKTDGFAGAFDSRSSLSLFANTKDHGSEKLIANFTMLSIALFVVLDIMILARSVQK